jgi:hypothetical protein
MIDEHNATRERAGSNRRASMFYAVSLFHNPSKEIQMSRITLTQVQYDVLEGATWGDDTAENLHRHEVGARRATLQQVKSAVKQLQRKGFVTVSKREGIIRPTGLGEAALSVVQAQMDVDDLQEKFNRKQRRAAK